MSISNLTAKQLKIDIKKGCTPEDLEQRYGCSNEDLRKRIQQLYSQGNGRKAQDVYKELEANRKLPRRVKKEEPAPDDQPSEETDAVPETENDGTLTLEDLIATAEGLSAAVVDLEGQHKALAGERHACIANLRQLQKKIEEIEVELQECHDTYEQSVSRANALADEMNRISANRREKVVALEAVRCEIEERQKISLFVYDDGRIEAVDKPDFIFDDTGYLDLKPVLSEKAECQDLRIRDIATLARLLTIARNIEKLDLACEASELETAFWAVKNSI